MARAQQAYQRASAPAVDRFMVLNLSVLWLHANTVLDFWQASKPAVTIAANQQGRERISRSTTADGLLDPCIARTIFNFLPHNAGVCGFDNLGLIVSACNALSGRLKSLI